MKDFVYAVEVYDEEGSNKYIFKHNYLDLNGVFSVLEKYIGKCNGFIDTMDYTDGEILVTIANDKETVYYVEIVVQPGDEVVGKIAKIIEKKLG